MLSQKLVITDAPSVAKALRRKDLGPCHGVVSIGEPGWNREELEKATQHSLFQLATMPSLFLGFDDCEYDLSPEGKLSGMEGPKWEDVEKLIAFSSLLPAAEYGFTLTHCMAGISRSSAAMAIMLAAKHPELTARQVFAIIDRNWDWARQQGLRQIYAICPNRRMIWMADELLKWEGRLGGACETLYYRSKKPFDPNNFPARQK